MLAQIRTISSCAIISPGMTEIPSRDEEEKGGKLGREPKNQWHFQGDFQIATYHFTRDFNVAGAGGHYQAGPARCFGLGRPRRERRRSLPANRENQLRGQLQESAELPPGRISFDSSGCAYGWRYPDRRGQTSGDGKPETANGVRSRLSNSPDKEAPPVW